MSKFLSHLTTQLVNKLAFQSMTTNEAQFEETMRIILDTARDSITSDFRITKCKHNFDPPPGRSYMFFDIAHERVHFGVKVTAMHDPQVSIVNISFEIPKGTTFNEDENTWSSDTNDYCIRLELKEGGILSVSEGLRPNFQGIKDRESLRAQGHDQDYGITSETIQNFQGIIPREILSVHFKKIRVLCLRHIEEEVNTLFIANRDHILAFVMGSHIRIGRDSGIQNIDSEIIRDITRKYMEMVLPNASAAAVSGGGVALA